MGNRKAKNDIAPIIRFNGLEGLRKLASDRGVMISDLFAESFKVDFLKTLDTVAKFTVREKTVDSTVKQITVSNELSDAELEKIIGGAGEENNEN